MFQCADLDAQLSIMVIMSYSNRPRTCDDAIVVTSGDRKLEGERDKEYVLLFDHQSPS